MGRLQNKIALVTGGGAGFGEGISKAYAREGATVLIADINLSAAEKVASAINSSTPSKAIPVKMDCTNRGDWESTLALAKEKCGGLDIVINNAGTTYKKQPSVDVTEEEFDKVIAVNTKSIYLSVKVVAPYFVEKKSGQFINTSSVAGMKTRPGMVWYGGTKGFVNVITQGLAAELGPSGIRVNSVCPLRAPTQLLELFSGVPDTPEERERFAQSVPLRRMSEPEDVAAAMVYLGSDEAGFVTGVCFPVDGGRLAV